MQNINQEFKDALALHRADELLFLPLIEKFEELKKVLESNFLMKRKEKKWYGKSNWVVQSALNVEIETRINHSTGKYLFIRINGTGYVMGIGQLGELKDRLFFCEGSISKRGETIVYITRHMFGTTDYYLENHLTTVQLFSHLIKKYNQYLVGN